MVRAGDIPLRPDTDRVINARPVPGGTYKWFLLPGTTLELTGKMGGFTRVRLDSGLEVWLADGDVVPLPSGTPVPRRVTLNARVRTAPDWVDVVIPIQGGERPAYFVDEGARSLTVTLYGTRANTDIINYADNDTLLRTVEWKQVLDDRAELDLALRQPLYGYLVLWEDGNLVVRVRRRPTIDERNPLRGLTIAVDPGHPPIGATGPTGLYEANAVLPVGEKVRQLLEQRGARVVMTRTTSDPVELGLRPIIARRENAHAYVSIHLNAYGDGVNPLVARNGSGTYFFHKLSEPLARPVERGLVRRMGLPNLGVYYDNLAVVRPSWMPMVLTEGAFVIIPEQEAAMRTPEFQARYAQGIVEGLEEYFRWLGKQ
jgi:N-acetylmuramoyl-L-alanine amidase